MIMKKKLRVFGFVIFCFFLTLALVGCTTDKKDDNPPTDVTDEVKISKLEIESNEYEIAYLDEEYVPQHVVVYAVYTDNSKKNVTDEATFSADTSKLGTTNVEVSYKEWKTTYELQVVKNTLERISLDISSAKVLYYPNDKLDITNLKVIGKYRSGKEELIPNYRIEMLLGGGRVSDLSTPGNYEIKIYVYSHEEAFTSSYTVRVVGENGEGKIYTRLEVDTTSTKQTFENEAFDSKGLKVYGVEDGTKELLNSSDYIVSLYYKSNRVNEFDASGEYEVRVTYTGNVECLNSVISYTVVYSVSSIKNVYPSITISSLNEANIEVPLRGTATTIQLTLTDEDGKSKSLDSLTCSLSNLDSTKIYSLSGSYMTVFDGKEQEVEVVPTAFSTAVFASFEQIDQSKTEENISANSISLSLEEFEKNVPAGFNLTGFEVLNSAGELLYDIPYSEELEGNLYVTNLNNNSSYLVKPYYENAMMTMSARETTYTYRFKFVGYWYLTRGDVNYRVRMRYNNTTLYTWYVGENQQYSNSRYCTFVLPIELEEEYYIAGCYEDLSDIHNDKDAEIVLALKNHSDVSFNVAFYGFNDVLLDLQVVQPSTAATAPNAASTVKWLNRTYKFDGFDRDFSNVTSNIVVHATYNLEPVYAVPTVSWQFRVGTTSAYFYEGYQNTTSIVSRKHTIIDLTGSTPDREIEDVQYKSYWYLIDALTPNTPYKYVLVIKYDLNDGAGEQELVKEIEFTTVTSDTSGNLTASIQQNSLCEIDITIDGYNGSWIYYSTNQKEFIVEYYRQGFCLNTCPAGTIYFYYGVDDPNNSRITYMYYTGQSYTVPKFEPMEIEGNYASFDFKNGNLYLKGENLDQRHFSIEMYYYVWEIESRIPYNVNYVWDRYDDELGHVFRPENSYVLEWLEEMSKYQGGPHPEMRFIYLLNGHEEQSLLFCRF